MADGRLKFLHEVLRPRIVRWGGGVVFFVAAYDSCSNQFPQANLPKLGSLLFAWIGMSGALMPWWGWLLILQGVVVYALFEYVRQHASGSDIPIESGSVESQSETLKSEVLKAQKLALALAQREYLRTAKDKFEQEAIEFREAMETYVRAHAHGNYALHMSSHVFHRALAKLNATMPSGVGKAINFDLETQYFPSPALGEEGIADPDTKQIYRRNFFRQQQVLKEIEEVLRECDRQASEASVIINRELEIAASNKALRFGFPSSP